MAKVQDEASTITAERGEVLLDGPDGVVVSLTPDAADKTSSRLKRGAQDARAQQSADKSRSE